MYLAWAAYYEGRTDAAYFNVLIPRFIEEILRNEGTRPCEVGIYPAVEFGLSDRAFHIASRAICSRKEEFHILFVHADTGGRAQEANLADRREALIQRSCDECGFDGNMVAYLSPRKELEAWAIADDEAVLAALGLSRVPENILPASPRAAEQLEDPKSTFNLVLGLLSSRRKNSNSFLVRIAQEQSFNKLRLLPSFQEFEQSLRRSLGHRGFI